MKNQKAIIITVALFLALISLSCAAVQGPMMRGEHKSLPTYQDPRMQRGELRGLPVQPTPPVRRVQPGKLGGLPVQPFPRPRFLTLKQQIDMLEKQNDQAKEEINKLEQLIKDNRKKIRDIKRRK